VLVLRSGGQLGERKLVRNGIVRLTLAEADWRRLRCATAENLLERLCYLGEDVLFGFWFYHAPVLVRDREGLLEDSVDGDDGDRSRRIEEAYSEGADRGDGKVG
jgi:hypothetical protein